MNFLEAELNNSDEGVPFQHLTGFWLGTVNTDTAISNLLEHSGRKDGEKMRSGFLGSLRPFQGVHENNFIDVMNSLVVVAPELVKQNRAAIELMVAIWDMCHRTRVYASYENSILIRNRLISDQDCQRLHLYLRTIESCMLRLLAGERSELAFRPYFEFLLTTGSSFAPEKHLVSLLDQLQISDDPDDQELASKLKNLIGE